MARVKDKVIPEGSLIHAEKIKVNRQESIDKVKEVAENLGIDPNWLMMIMNVESEGTFDPSIKSKNSSATGLIQFMASTAEDLGTTTDKLSKMSFTEQMDWVERYYRRTGVMDKVRSANDLYLATFYPAAVGKPRDYVLGDNPKRIKEIAKGNPLFDPAKNGYITVGQIEDVMKSRESSWRSSYEEDDAIYSEDEEGQIITIDPKQATEEEVANSRTYKDYFYNTGNNNYDPNYESLTSIEKEEENKVEESAEWKSRLEKKVKQRDFLSDLIRSGYTSYKPEEVDNTPFGVQYEIPEILGSAESYGLPEMQRGGEYQEEVYYGTPEYERAYREGRIQGQQLDPAVITVDSKTGKNILDQYPYYNNLTEQEKEYFHDTSPIGSQIRSKAMDGRGFDADRAREFTKNWLVDTPLSAQQIPQSAIGNNGMFDMTNPNIYKAIVPGAIMGGIGLNSLNNNTEENNFQQGGQIPVSSRGLYDYPNTPVMVPTESGKITMQGIGYPVLGVSMETGEQQLMQPGQKYTFENTRNVFEIPLLKMEDGGEYTEYEKRGFYNPVEEDYFIGESEDYYNDFMDKVVSIKGGEAKDYYELMNRIAFIESRGTMNPSIKQDGGGPGRGVYQFEKGKRAGAWIALKRLISFYDKNDMEKPEWVTDLYEKNKDKEDLDVVDSGLTRQQQDMLFLGDSLMKKGADLSKVINKEQDYVDYWADYHWAGPKESRAEKVRNFNVGMFGYNNWTKSENYRDYMRNIYDIKAEEQNRPPFVLEDSNQEDQTLYGPEQFRYGGTKNKQSKIQSFLKDYNRLINYGK